MKHFAPLLLLFAFLLTTTPAAVQAQDENPPTPYDENGYLNSADMTVDMVELPLCSPPSACTTNGQPDGNPETGTFIRLTDEDGNVYVVTTAETGERLDKLADAYRPIAWTAENAMTAVTYGTSNYTADQLAAILSAQGLEIGAGGGLDQEALMALIQNGGVLGGYENWTTADWEAYFASHPLEYQISLAYLYLYGFDSATCQEIPSLCPQDPPPASACSAPVVSSGRISVTAYRTAPNYVLVVGQDEEKRGGDVTWEVRVEPTIYTWWTLEPVYGTTCSEWHAGDPSADCRTKPSMWYNDGYTTTGIIRYDCVSHTAVYPESLHRVSPYANLSKSSRDWILTGDLQIRYPGAFLHNPDFSWAGDPNTGYFDGNTYVWTFSRISIQFADPGYFDLGASGSTTGTPVSDPRGFSLSGGQTDVYLKEVVIIH